MKRAFLLLLAFSISAALLTGAGYEEFFDPSDYAVRSIENIGGKPFSAKIRNLMTGRTYEFYPGDRIGPTEIVEVTENSIVLEEKLTKKQYYLPVPINDLEETMIRKSRDADKLLFDEARKLFKIGKARSASEKLKFALEKNPGFSDAHFLLAVIYHENRMYKDAFLHYKECVVINRKNFRAYYNMGQIFADTQNYKEALFYVRKALYLKPDYEKGLNLYAHIQDAMEQENLKKGSMQSLEAKEKQRKKLQRDMKRVAEEIRQLVNRNLEIAGKNDKQAKEEKASIKEQIAVKKRLYEYQTKQMDKMLKKK